MTFYMSLRDEPRIVWNANNPSTMDAMTNHLESTSFSSDYATYNQKLREFCHFPGKLRPWVSLEQYHALSSSPVTVDYTSDLLPIISRVKYGKCFADIRVPNADYYYAYIHSFITILINSSFEIDKIKWENKKSLAFWRGATTGARYTIENMDKYHRQRLMKLYQNHSSFDIALSETEYCNSPNCDEYMRSQFRYDQFRKYDYLMQNKYLIDIV